MPWFSLPIAKLAAPLATVVVGGVFKLLHERLKLSGRHDPVSAPPSMREVQRLQDQLEELRRDAAQNAEYRRRCEELDAIKKAREEYPRPDWLPEPDPRTLNIAIFGSSGVGKSSLINALLRKDDAADDAATVGVTETTRTPQLFPRVVPVMDEEKNPVRLMTLNYFDLPGGGTDNFKAADYVSTFGLRYFDVVVVAFHDRVNETEKGVIAECRKHNIKFCVVRTRTDEAVENNKRAFGAKAQETVDKILKQYGPELGGLTVFPVSVVNRNDPAYPLAALEREIIRLVWQARDLKRVVQQSLSEEQFVNQLHSELFPNPPSFYELLRNLFGKRSPSLRDMANVGKSKQPQKSEFAAELDGVGKLRARL